MSAASAAAARVSVDARIARRQRGCRIIVLSGSDDEVMAPFGVEDSYQFAFNKLDMILFHATLWEAWMRSLIVGDKPTVARLAERLKQARSRAEYQRIQCVLIRATLGSSAAQIAQLLGWATATVHVLHSRWSREGDAIFDLRDRGGRRHQHLSVEQEQALPGRASVGGAAGGLLRQPRLQRPRSCRTGADPRPDCTRGRSAPSPINDRVRMDHIYIFERELVSEQFGGRPRCPRP